jgi:hypothetical protein
LSANGSSSAANVAIRFFREIFARCRRFPGLDQGGLTT